MGEIEENGQFKMPLDDEVEEGVIPAAVDELRLEKINTRVTIISILIPVLIVIVLVIAYLDIKKRVVQTEDTGSMSFQNLSNDMESRFSSLSLRQARLEEQMASFIDRNDQALARIEIKLKNLEETTQALPGDLATKKALNEAISKLDNKLGNVAVELENVQAQSSSTTEQWRSEMEQWQQGLEKLRADLDAISPQLTDMGNKLAALDKAKIDKPALDLAVSLEGLRIKQDLKSPIDQLTDQVEQMRKQLRTIERQGASSQSPSPPAPKPQSVPAPSSSGNGIKEQPLRQ